ncbi:MAG: hypothetical protein RI985_1054 [Chloroflexota bacterium]|jgi:hypothetical protein
MTDGPIKSIPYHVNWLAADKGRIREEIAYLADRGFTHVKVSPAWFRLQPRPLQVDRVVMATLEACYDAMHRAGIASITTLLTAGYMGHLELPDWHHAADVVGWLQGRTSTPIYRRGGSIRVNGVMRRLQLANPYRTDTFRDGQRELIRVVMGYFAGHPAARHWLLAPGWSYLADVAPAVAQAWWQELTGLARRVHAGAVLLTQIDGPQLIGHGFDAGMAGREVDMVCVDTAMPLLPHRRRRLPFLPMRFLRYVVAGLTKRPTLIGMHPIVRGSTSGWESMMWYDRRVAVPVVTDAQLVDLWHAHMAVLQHHAVAGVVYPRGWQVGFDGDRDVIGDKLADITGDSVYRQLDAMMREWQHIGVIHDSFDDERYRYQPQKELWRLWHEFSE